MGIIPKPPNFEANCPRTRSLKPPSDNGVSKGRGIATLLAVWPNAEPGIANGAGAEAGRLVETDALIVEGVTRGRVICASMLWIGVTPASGSFSNVHPYASAPISLSLI